MNMKPSQKIKLTPTPWDALVVAAVLALALAVGLSLAGRSSGDDALVCVISQYGEEIDRVVMREHDLPQTIVVDSPYRVQIEITAEGVYVAQADCPNEDCVHTGQIKHAGQSIVCLPDRLVIELTGTDEDAAFDAVVH